MNRITKKILIFLSQIFVSGCNITGFIVKDGDKIIYHFTWVNIGLLLIITLVILWVVRHYLRDKK